MVPRDRPPLDLFLVGAPKSGSTLLARLIGLHPDIYLAKGKDRNFFATDFALPATSREEAQYWAMFDEWEGEDRIGEASVFYLYSGAATRRLSSRFAGASILILVRNPIDLVHSYHRQMVFNGWQPVKAFDEALLAGGGGLGGRVERSGACYRPPSPSGASHSPPAPSRASPSGSPGPGSNAPEADPRVLEREGVFDPRLLDYGFVGCLSPHIERWMEAFGRDQVELVFFDDLISGPEEVLRGLFDRLGVDPEAEVAVDTVLGDRMAKNAHKVRRSETLRDAIHLPGPWLRRLVRLLLPSTRLRGLVAGFLDRHNRTFVERPQPSPEVRTHLESCFEPEIRRLEKLSGRDLGHWLS